MPPPSVDHVARAYELLRLERYDLALAEVERALAANPRSAEAHICGAWALRDQGRLADAETAARAALAAAPQLPAAHNVLACVHWRAGRRAAAEDAFRQMLACPTPAPPEFVTNYARFLLAGARAAPALAFAEQALAAAPNLAIAHEVRGQALAELGRREEAAAALRTALQRDPRNVNAHNRLGLVALADGQVGQALDSFREALRLRPGDAAARANLVRALKARQPLYGRLLGLVLRARSTRAALYFVVAGAILFFAPALIAASAGEGSVLDTAMYNLWSWVVYGFLGVLLVGAFWNGIIDPIFNTLLLLDPLGRQVVDYGPGEAVRVGALGLLVLSLAGFAFSLIVLGEEHPASNLTAGLVATALVALLLPADQAKAAWATRRATWAGYAGIVLGTATLAVGLAFASDLLTGLGSVLLDGGLVVYLLAWLVRRARGAPSWPPRGGRWAVALLAGLVLLACVVGLLAVLDALIRLP